MLGSPRILNAALLASVLLLAALPAAAAPRQTRDLPSPYSIPRENPVNMDDIWDVVGRNFTTRDGEIYQDVNERAVCGGWNREKTVIGKIPTVFGVPGRRADPLGNLPSGMAARNEQDGVLQDGYIYPRSDDVRGWSTICRPGFPPYLDDQPPCKDESLNGKATPAQCGKLCPRINRWQVPVWVVIWNLWGPNADGDIVILNSSVCVQIGKEEQTFNADPKDGDCCERMGPGGSGPNDAPSCGEKYGGDAEDPRFDPGLPSDAHCRNPPPTDPRGVWSMDAVIFAGWYYCCSGALVTQMEYEQCTITASSVCAEHQDARRNCVRCEGDGAPRPGNPANDSNGEPIVRGSGQREETGCRAGYDAQVSGSQLVPSRYVSYFREYANAGYTRQKVDEAPRDITQRTGIPVACYGFYDEFDPKTRRTLPSDARCVIGAYFPANEFRTFYKTQRGKGLFGQETQYPDPDPAATANIRQAGFNANDDLWYQNLGGGFSLVNGKVFEERFAGDLTAALMDLDVASFRSSFQLTESRPRSSGALIRATDDTVALERGDDRSIVRWWQEAETAAHDLIHPAVAHIVMPSAWSVGLEVRHPLIATATSSSSVSAMDIRREAIEMQIESQDDLLGEVASFLLSSLLLPIEQQPVPVVVPAGSSTDFRAYKEGWIRWKEVRERAGGSVPVETQNVIDRLEEYAVRIDEVRAMRADLALYLAEILQRQRSALATVTGWLEDNTSQYEAFQQQRQQRANLLYLWQGIQQAYRDFTDRTNMPWCKNDRFTTPIYSLLDPWMPGRPTLTGNDLPRISIEIPTDVFIDLTTLQTGTGAISVPVLRPVQILTDNAKIVPPGPETVSADIPVLPPLPSISRLDADISRIPRLVTGSAIVTRYPDVSISPGDESALYRIYDVVTEMDREYKQFWDAVTKPRCGTLEGDKRCGAMGQNTNDPLQDCCVIGGEEEYCRKGWDQDTCVHVEMDLIERFTRMGARPGVLLHEDFRSMGEWRWPLDMHQSSAFPPCDPADWSCLNPHGIEQNPRTGWYTETRGIETTQQIWMDELRARLVQESHIQEGTPSTELFIYSPIRNAITPSFDVRPPAELSPAPPSSTSSSSASP
jgi:hypothetical protein